MPKLESNSLVAQLTRDPLLVDPQSVMFFTTLLHELADSEDFQLAMEASVALAGADADEYWSDDWAKPYNVSNGTLTIPVKGVLMNKLGLQLGRWATGYQYIERAFARGMEDPEVKRIAFDVDSPGGQVAGNFELSEKIAGDDRKPVYAFANDHAYSAAYSIASAADAVYVPRSGGVGSIGVIATHVSFEGMLDKAGIKVTHIFAGKHKADGSPYKDLPEDVQARFQKGVDKAYSEFVGLVASNRGLDEQAVRDTEALTYDGQDAVDIGLADAVVSMQTKLAELEADQPESLTMTTKKTAPAEATNDGQFTQEQLDAAVSEATTSATAAGATAERERISAILACDEAEARPAAAMSTAMNTDMSVEKAAAFLATLPEEAKAEAAEETPAPAASGPTPFDKQMSESGSPNVGAEAPGEPGEDTPQAKSAAIVAAFGAATGKARKRA